jgi:hypothetical protein
MSLLRDARHRIARDTPSVLMTFSSVSCISCGILNNASLSAALRPLDGRFPLNWIWFVSRASREGATAIRHRIVSQALFHEHEGH